MPGLTVRIATAIRRMGQAGGLLLLLLSASGCVTRYGVPMTGPMSHDLAYAYIPLSRSVFFVSQSDAGGVALGGGVAVTVAHAREMLPADTVIGETADYDLMFFRTDRTVATLRISAPFVGQKVIAYAHYGAALHQAEGVVTALEADVEPRCGACAVQKAFTFSAEAGPGFSGGPVLDAATGKLVGIVFGYNDDAAGHRQIYAYPMARVETELRHIRAQH